MDYSKVNLNDLYISLRTFEEELAAKLVLNIEKIDG